MTTTDQHISAFLECVKELPGLWRSVDLRLVAVRCGDTWYNLLARCSLTSRPIARVPRVQHWPKTANLFAFQTVYSVSRLPELIRLVSAGEYNAGGTRVVFATPPEGPDKSQRPYDYASFAAASAGYPRRVRDRFPIAHELILSGGSAQTLYQLTPGGRDALDQALWALNSPWDGVAALIHDGLGLLDSADHSSSIRAVFLAPLEVSLEPRSCSLSAGGTLRLKAVAATPSVGRRSLVGYSGTNADGTPIASSFLLKGRTWKQVRGLATCETREEIGEAGRLTLLLRLGSQVASRAAVLGPPLRKNSRIAAYMTVDPELRRLKAALFGADGTKAKEFERAVARLFVLAGLAVDMFSDDPRAGQAADAVVYDDLTSTTLVVECTTGPLNQDGKLARLKKRMADVREAIGNTGTPRAQAVIASSLLGNRLAAAELEAAGKDSMAVLSREDLERILQLASDGEPPDLTLDLVRDRVPRRGMSGLIGHWGS